MRSAMLAISRIRWIAVWGITLFALILAAGAIEPILDSLAFAIPPTLIAVLAVFVWLLLRRGRSRPVLMSVAGVAIVLLSPTAAPEIAGLIRRSFPPPAPEGPSFKLLSLNLGQRDDISRLLHLIAREKPDAVVLAEAGETAIRRLEAALDAYPTRVTCARIGYCGVSIFARAPGQLGPGGAWIADGLQKSPELNDGMRYAAVKLETEAGVMHLLATHVLRSVRGGPMPDQLPRLEEKLHALTDPAAAVLAGDLNASSWSWALARFDGATPLQRQTFALPTWPAPGLTGGAALAFTGIDHVYTGANWSLVAIRLTEDVGSDHLPVLTVLRPTRAAPLPR